MQLMVPFVQGICGGDFQADCTMFFGRPVEDFATNCLLYCSAKSNAMNAADVRCLRSNGFRVCYSYNVLDFENREFTELGYGAICDDIQRAIDWGYTHIQLANPYVIELATNEYASQVSVILSSQLEFNSGRARVFLDVLNNSSSVTQLIVSQNQLTKDRYSEIGHSFPGVQLVVEVDRWVSDVQVIHERYYNILYGYDTEHARAELRRVTTDPALRRALRPVSQFLFEQPGVLYKVGEINTSAELILANIEALRRGNYSLLKNVDLDIW